MLRYQENHYFLSIYYVSVLLSGICQAPSHQHDR